MTKQTTYTKNWWNQNWKWVLPTTGILACIFLFFTLTGNTAFRYGAVYLDQTLIKDAITAAQKNNTSIEKFGTLSPVTFIQLIEGEITNSNTNNTIQVSINIQGTKRRGKLDITAHKDGKK